MRAWQATVQDEAGNAVFNPQITVYESDGVTIASIYNEDGSPKENPFTGTLEGFAQFWAPRGTYRVVGADGGTISESWQVDLADEEALQLATEAQAVQPASRDALLANTATSYPVGTIFATRAEGYAYEVVSSDPDLTTAGGVMLRVLPTIDGSYPVGAFGAVGDGVTNDTAAFQAAIDALPAEGGVIRLSGNYIVTGASTLDIGEKKVTWVGEGMVNNSAIWPMPGVRDSYIPTVGRSIFQDLSGDVGYTRRDNQRNASYSGGNTGRLTFLERWYTTIQPTVGDPGEHRAEKAGLFGVENYSPNANGVALMTQARGKSGGAVWALECNTYSDVVPTVNAHRSAEFNIQATGADVNNLRWIVDVVAHGAIHTVDNPIYDPSANIHVGVVVHANTANLINGVMVRGRNGWGQILNAAFIAYDLDADILVGTTKTTSAKVKLGAEITSGTLSDIISQGLNSASEMIKYSSIRQRIGDATDGAETGVVQIRALAGGVDTVLMQLSGGFGNSISLRVGGNLKQVSEGPADSAGTGFRMLRVEN